MNWSRTPDITSNCPMAMSSDPSREGMVRLERIGGDEMGIREVISELVW